MKFQKTIRNVFKLTVLSMIILMTFGCSSNKTTISNSEIKSLCFTNGMRVREVLPCKYDSIDNFSEDLALVIDYDKEYSCGFIDKNGKIVIPFLYDSAFGFSSGLAYVEKNDQCGYIDKNGNVAIPFINRFFSDNMTYTGSFSEGLVPVGKFENEWKYGYMNTEGKVVIDYQFNSAGPFKDGLAVVEKDHKDVIVDKTGKIAIDTTMYDSIESYISGLFVVRMGRKKGLLDIKGNEVVECIYDRIMIENDKFGNEVFFDTIVVNNDGKYGVIDRNGKELIPCKYVRCESFMDGLALIEKPKVENTNSYYDQRNTLTGYVDINGEETIPCQYIFGQYFSDGVAWVTKSSSQIELIDKSGKTIASGDFYNPHPFSEGLSMVEMDNNYCYVNTEGKVVINTGYDGEDFSEGLAAVYDGWKYKLIDKNGNEVFNNKYEEISPFINGYAKTTLEGKVGLLTYLK